MKRNKMQILDDMALDYMNSVDDPGFDAIKQAYIAGARGNWVKVPDFPSPSLEDLPDYDRKVLCKTADGDLIVASLSNIQEWSIPGSGEIHSSCEWWVSDGEGGYSLFSEITHWRYIFD